MDIIPIVCARCGEERPAGDFVSKRKSAGNTKNCLDCRNKNNSHYSRSRDATLTLRNLASAERRRRRQVLTRNPYKTDHGSA